MDETYLKSIISFNKEVRDILVAYFENLPENIKLFLMAQEGITIKRIKSHYDPDKQGEFYYAAFLITVDRYRSIELRSKRKGSLSNHEMEFLDFLNMGRTYLKRKYKKKSKKDLVMKYKGLILKLRNNKFSWDKISVYLWSNYDFKISAFYLKMIFGNNKSRGLLND